MMEMDKQVFDDLVREIRRQGYDAATAGRLARLIGDTPTRDAQGRLVVFDETGKHAVARLQWSEWFGS
jgi:hypothetical protein